MNDAIKSESYEIDTLYREFTEKAKPSEDAAAATRFEEIRHDEIGHRDTFKIALAELKS